MRRAFLLAPLVLALGACGSSPKTQFYTLDPVGGAPTTAHGTPLQIGHVDLPGALDRQSIVTHAAGNRVDISDQDRWAAPLDELVRRALTEDMRTRLPHGTVLTAGDTAPPGTRTLKLNVQQFMPDTSGDVVLDADWGLEHSGKTGTPRHASIQTRMDGHGGEAIANAMSRALGQLADDIVQQM
jgi:uncharacterized lipoprotein YmbA